MRPKDIANQVCCITMIENLFLKLDHTIGKPWINSGIYMDFYDKIYDNHMKVQLSIREQLGESYD